MLLIGKLIMFMAMFNSCGNLPEITVYHIHIIYVGTFHIKLGPKTTDKDVLKDSVRSSLVAHRKSMNEYKKTHYMICILLSALLTTNHWIEEQTKIFRNID